MKIGILTDTHAGARGDNTSLLKYQEKFFEEIFFPVIDKEKIDILFHLGDGMDHRKFTNHYVFEEWNRFFFGPLVKKQIKLFYIIGNHDTYFKNSNKVNSPNLFLSKYPNIEIFSEPTEIDLFGLKVLIVPWICQETEKQSFNLIEKTSATVLFGHLELKGFEMYKNLYHFEGIEENIFEKFDVVASGHFHHKSRRNNIWYLGSTYEMSWADFDDDRGFHIFETDTKKFEYIKNPLKLFHKIFYDDKAFSLNEIMDIDIEQYKDCYVKLIIKNKENPFWYDTFIDKLDKAGMSDLQIVDDHMNLNTGSDSEIFDKAEDIQTILKNYVSQIDYEDKDKLFGFMQSLYNEAVNL